MTRALLVMVLALGAGCGKKQDAPPGTPAGSGSVKVAAAPADAAAGSANAGSAAPAVGALQFDPDTDDQTSSLAVAFDHKVPRLPALSEDGRSIARFEGLGDGPIVPQPKGLVIAKLPGNETLETLPIMEVDEALKAGAAGHDTWTTPETTKLLHARAAAVLARLRGFRSLESVATGSSGAPDTTKLGELRLTETSTATDQLVLELRDGKGAVLHHEAIEPSSSGTFPGPDGPVPCTYRPSVSELLRDADKKMVYVEILFRYHEECSPLPRSYVVWSLDPAAAAPVDAMRDIVGRQFDLVGVNSTAHEDIVAEDAIAITAGAILNADHLKPIGVVEHAMDYSDEDNKDVQITVSRDGKSAWASELASITILEPNTSGREAPWRASDVLVKTAAGWRIAALAWTEPRANAEVNRKAKAGTAKTPTLDVDPGDAGLRAAFAKLTTDGVDAIARARTDLVAIGSGPGERTVGGAVFATAWNAAWKGKVAIISSVARAMPSGTTGWVASTIELAKPGYKIAFTVFSVFDKAPDGTWSLVHIQFAA